VRLSCKKIAKTSYCINTLELTELPVRFSNHAEVVNIVPANETNNSLYHTAGETYQNGIHEIDPKIAQRKAVKSDAILHPVQTWLAHTSTCTALQQRNARSSPRLVETQRAILPWI
jgi:hypothetical protein